jgi:hypothetical protein
MLLNYTFSHINYKYEIMLFIYFHMEILDAFAKPHDASMHVEICMGQR